MKFLLALSFMLSTLCLLYFAGFRLNVTPSMPRGIYRLIPGSLRRGDMAAFCLDGPWAQLAARRGYVASGQCQSGIRPLIKNLAAIPGDGLEISDYGITVLAQDGKGHFWLAPAQSEDGHGRPLPASDLRAGLVPDGMALLLSGHPGGFDGRYFGLVPIETLKRIKTVLTF